MLTVDALRAIGVQVEEGLNRCLNNEAFYLRLVGMALDDSAFPALRAAIENKDLDAAFEQAHRLKGALGNLSLTPLYEPTAEMTEFLRARKEMDYLPHLERIEKTRAALLALRDA